MFGIMAQPPQEFHGRRPHISRYVRVQEPGVKLSPSGIVPLALLPPLTEEAQPEFRLLALERIAAEFPALIPRSVVRHIAQQSQNPSDDPEGQNGDSR